ncbi:FAD-dependent oxidoreductase [Aliiroseovarius sp. F47248L]|uniref:NAD(P)/FAD-dependent oxidoreductase n=1 Tax=Aliiroseovarius sp. F47248L TaxID=2926420 RepID=UPI001FF4C355|nr:FAD-dependent oxidoreductase [Aliiroseovarius sp. F47248L]MCK0139636.1 FAD-binding oxidoreductase [Aliiroseovarius sp. F47248L]
MSPINPEITIVGGGVVGLSVAMGLLLAGHRVRVLDGADSDARASQGNFGLVWGQGKGWDFAPYAQWTNDALAAWPDFAHRLTELSGIDVALDQSGGFEFFTDPDEMDEFAGMLAKQQSHLGNRFSHEIIGGDELRKQIPGIGGDVVGASYSQLDGHVNPLRFLRALRLSVKALGGQIRAEAHVSKITPASGGGFELNLENGESLGTDKVLLCAGLGAMKLAASLGFSTQIRPQRGELLITEKLGERLPFLSSTIRQVDEGGVQIGGTKADVGLDDSETLDVMAGLARHAVAVFPALADVRVVRAWGALRVMSPDGFPVYSHSRRHPGAYFVTCHSGVTLAPLHASVLTDWIENTPAAPDLEAFDEHRFTLSNAA